MRRHWNIGSGYFDLPLVIALFDPQWLLPVEEGKALAAAEAGDIIPNITDGMRPFFGPVIEPIKKRHNLLILQKSDRKWLDPFFTYFR